MKILFINQYYHPDLSATSQMLTDLAEDLAGMGWRVSVIASRSLYVQIGDEVLDLPSQESHRGVQIYRTFIAASDRRSIASRLRSYLSFHLSALVKALTLPRQDVVVILTDPPMLPALAIALRWMKGSRVVIWAHDLYPDLLFRLGYFSRHGIPGWVSRGLMAAALRSAERIVVLGRCMKNVLLDQAIRPDRLRVRLDWADGAALGPLPHETNRFRTGRSGQFLVVYSGNLGMSHSLEEIEQSMLHFKDHPEIRFVWIGGGHRLPELAAFVKDHGLKTVELLPFRPRSELRESLSAADVHLITMRAGFEGLIVPCKIFGIMAVGRPVVFVGPKESEAALIIEEADCGLVIPPGDAAGLVGALTRLYDDPGRAARLGKNGRAYFEKHFERRAAIKEFGELLREVAAGPRPTGFLKRFFDIGLSGIGLIGSAPLWAVFAALVKLGDGGPVFYRQERVGKSGRIFFALKFRSMVPNAEAGLGPVQAGYDDPRVTRVGRFLRATAMDELPQLWNIFIGDMSFVGPRALRPMENEIKPVRGEALGVRGKERETNDVPNFHLRHRVRPGLTGLAQIYAPRDASRRNKLRYDLLYARSRSFWLDLKLIALSFWITFRGRWEAREKKV